MTASAFALSRGASAASAEYLAAACRARPPAGAFYAPLHWRRATSSISPITATSDAIATATAIASVVDARRHAHVARRAAAQG